MINLSGLMIVQDEEACLARAIDSFHDCLDELVILDGGSVDNTRSIASQYDKVRLFDMRMPDDFAVQLNKGIQLCKGKWVVRLDADENFDSYVTDCLPRLIKSEEYDAYAFSRKTFIDNVLGNIYDHDFQIRLFRKHCRYESNANGLHETITGYSKLQRLNLDIKHYKLGAWQHKDDMKYWDMGQAPDPGWVKENDTWVYMGVAIK